MLGQKRFEMQNVSFDAFAIFSRQDGIVVKQFHNLVRSYKFRRQLAVLIEEVVDTHKHLLVKGELVNLGMFVKCPFLLIFLHFTMLNCRGTLLSRFGEPSLFVDKKVFRARVGLRLKTCGIGGESMHELKGSRANGRLVGGVVGEFHGGQ